MPRRQLDEDGIGHKLHFYVSLTLPELLVLTRYAELLNAQHAGKIHFDRTRAVSHAINSLVLPAVERAEARLANKTPPAKPTETVEGAVVAEKTDDCFEAEVSDGAEKKGGLS